MTVKEICTEYSKLGNETLKKQCLNKIKITPYVPVLRKDALADIIARRTVFEYENYIAEDGTTKTRSTENVKVNTFIGYILFCRTVIEEYTNLEIDKEHFDVKKYMRETFVVYEFNQVNDVFASMRKEHATLAIVLDEYGVMSGIVTFEDIVEEIVGEIDDEYDDASDDIVKINDHEYLVDGSLNLNEVNDEIDTHFESEDFESIGGLVLGEFSGVPKIKDKIEFPGVTIIIEKMHKNRIELLRLIIHEMKEEEEGEEKHQ